MCKSVCKTAGYLRCISVGVTVASGTLPRTVTVHEAMCDALSPRPLYYVKECYNHLSDELIIQPRVTVNANESTTDRS